MLCPCSCWQESGSHAITCHATMARVDRRIPWEARTLDWTIGYPSPVFALMRRRLCVYVCLCRACSLIAVGMSETANLGVRDPLLVNPYILPQSLTYRSRLYRQNCEYWDNSIQLIALDHRLVYFEIGICGRCQALRLLPFDSTTLPSELDLFSSFGRFSNASSELLATTAMGVLGGTGQKLTQATIIVAGVASLVASVLSIV
jgi:hypothetical protein